MANEEGEFLKGYSDRDLLVTSLERIKGLRSDLDARDARFTEAFARLEKEMKTLDEKFTNEVAEQKKRIDELKTLQDQRDGAGRVWKVAAAVMTLILLGMQALIIFK